MMEVIERVLEPMIPTTQIQIALTIMENLHLAQIHPEEAQRCLSLDKKAMEVQMMEVIERALGPITRTMQIQIVHTMMETLHFKEVTEVRMMETIERDREMIVPITQAQEALTMTKTLHMAQTRPEEAQSFLSLVMKAMVAQMMKTIEKDQGTRVLTKKIQKACSMLEILLLVPMLLDEAQTTMDQIMEEPTTKTVAIMITLDHTLAKVQTCLTTELAMPEVRQMIAENNRQNIPLLSYIIYRSLAQVVTSRPILKNLAIEKTVAILDRERVQVFQVSVIVHQIMNMAQMNSEKVHLETIASKEIFHVIMAARMVIYMVRQVQTLEKDQDQTDKMEDWTLEKAPVLTAEDTVPIQGRDLVLTEEDTAQTLERALIACILILIQEKVQTQMEGGMDQNIINYLIQAVLEVEMALGKVLVLMVDEVVLIQENRLTYMETTIIDTLRE